MLKRNKVLVAFMLVAVLCMSIGFAAISDTLNVDGTLNLDFADNGELDKAFEEKVYFSNPKATETDKLTTSSVSADGNTYTFVLGTKALQNAGDTYEVTVDIKNENKDTAKLEVSAIAEGDLTDWITVEKELAETVAGEGQTTLKITVKLDSVTGLTGENTLTSAIAFTITATPTT